MDYNKAAIELHKRLKGKIEVTARAETNNKDELSDRIYAGSCGALPVRSQRMSTQGIRLHEKRQSCRGCNRRKQPCSGSGDIGPAAGMPVMEGKCALFKRLCRR